MPRQCCFLPARTSTIFSLTLILVIHTFAVSKARVLHTFHGGKDGARPWATLLLDNKTGTLYGTTVFGGTGCVQTGPGSGPPDGRFGSVSAFDGV